MDPKQFDAALSDAEKRLRRLKVLYEQWFVGLERVEPSTPRKELEDVIARLRKEQVTNTAQRFRLQQLVQRHVSFSTHWRRIGRQIEEGTFQRDLQRARKRTRKGAGKEEANGAELEVSYDVDVDVDLTDVLAEADRAAEAALGERKSAPQPSAAAEVDVSARTFELKTGVGPRLPPPQVPQPAAAGSPPRAAGPLDLSRLKPGAARATRMDGAGQPGPAEPDLGAALAGADAARAAAPAATRTSPDTAAASGNSQAWPAGAVDTGQLRAPRPLVAPPAAAGKVAPPRPLGGIAAPPPASGERRPAPPPSAAEAPATGSLRAARTSLGTPSAAADGEGRRSPSGSPRAISPFALPAAGSVRPKPLTPPKAPPPPPVVPKAAASAQAGPAAAAGQPGASAVSIPAGVRPAVSTPAGVGAPRPATSAQPRRPESMPRPPAAAPRPANSNGPGSSAFDMERIYSQYVAAREQNRERTDNVKRDSLEKTIRGMLPQLEKKHAGKQIDFEVVVKDGKVALKPVAK